MVRTLLSLLLTLTFVPAVAQNWLLQNLYPGVEFNNINFTNQDTGYVFGDSTINGTFVKGLAMKTLDQGNSWTELPLGSVDYRIFDSYIIDAYIYAAGRSAAGGGNTGLFVQSNDAGQTWINAATFPERLFAVGFIDQNTGWVGGKNGFLVKTTNGGVTWSAPINITGEDIFDIDFFDSTTGLIACGGGELFKTADGGLTWTLVASSVPDDLTAVAIAGVNLAYVCGTSGTIICSTDKGNTWNTQQSGTGFDFQTISFYDSTNGFIAGPGGIMVHTNSAGQTWSIMSSNCIDDISSMKVLDANSGWFCTIEGAIFKLTNPTGIASVFSQQSTGIFNPNPAASFTTVRLPEGKYLLNIYSAEGKLLISESGITDYHKIDVSSLPPGIYFSTVSDDTSVYRNRLLKL